MAPAVIVQQLGVLESTGLVKVRGGRGIYVLTEAGIYLFPTQPKDLPDFVPADYRAPDGSRGLQSIVRHSNELSSDGWEPAGLRPNSRFDSAIFVMWWLLRLASVAFIVVLLALIASAR